MWVVRVIESCTKNVNKNKKMEFKPFLIVLVTTSVILFLISSTAQAVQTVPNPPTGLSAIPISPTSVSLSWFPPQNNGSSAITHYKIEYKTPPADYSVLATIGNVTSYNQTGLTTGKSYIYRVSAINSVGTSSPSSEAVATPTSTSAPLKNIPPNPPTGLTATSYSGTQINLSWNPPANNGGPPIIGYKIEYHIDSGNFTNLISNTGSASTSYSHTGLSTGHTFTYRVFAINSIGIGGTSNEASTVPTKIITVPPSPTNLNAYPASKTSISLSWTAPQDNGGSAITGYKIEYKSGSGSYLVLIANTASTVTSYLHTGLTTDTTYTYRVSAINSIGIGDTSNEASAVPTKTYTPTGVIAVAVSPTQIDLSWNPPSETFGQPIAGYRIDQKLSSNVFNTIVDNTDKTTSYSIKNLSTGKTYTFVIVTLFTGGVESNPSPEASAIPTSISASPSLPPEQTSALPDPPTGLNATKFSVSSTQLLWVAPSNNGKPPVIAYKIEFKTGSGPWTVLTANAGISTSYMHSGLTTNTYTYRVSAINSIGTGSPSVEASVTLTNNNPTPPPVIESSGGMLVVTNTSYSISYNILNGRILDISVDKDTFSLHIQLESKSDGILSLNLPRELIDAKKANGNDDDYLVTSNNQLLKFNEIKTTDMRTLAINFPAETNEISIYGTNVVPEFPILIPVLVIALIPVIFFSRFIK
jgi:predicted phage tail protein